MTITIEIRDEEFAQLVIDALLIARQNYPFGFIQDQLLREQIKKIKDQGEKEGWDLDDEWD